MTARYILAAFVAIVISLASAACGRAQDAGGEPCGSSIQVLFNQYGDNRIETGSTIWFSSVIAGIDGMSDTPRRPITITVRNAHITFGTWPYTIDLPDSSVTFDSDADAPVRLWRRGSWYLRLSPADAREAFLDGMPFVAPQPFIPGSSGPVTWTATFEASQPGLTVHWAWSAAAYSRFGANGRLIVKPVGGSWQKSDAGDPAGTPEIYRSFVIPGAMGNGVPQYAGARSATATVRPCLAAVNGGSPASGRLYYATGAPHRDEEPFSSPVTSSAGFADGTTAQAVGRCGATDLCALLKYRNGDRLAVYSEGAAYCEPYVLFFSRTNGERTVYAFSRNVDHDARSGLFGPACGRSRITHMLLDGGKIGIVISENADGTLRFDFDRAQAAAPQ